MAIPDGAKNVRLVYAEDYPDVLRLEVGIEVKNRYGKIRVPWKYVGKKLVVLIPKEVYDEVNNPKGVMGKRKKTSK